LAQPNFALTSLPAKVKEFWPWWTEYYTNHNYPHIVSMQKELKDVFLKRESFEEYMKRGFELVKKYPEMSPDALGEE